MTRPPKSKPVEERLQTRHKLEVVGRWWAAWCSICAQSKSTSWCRYRLFLVDGMAGEGAHESREHPDHERSGTAVLALWEARRTQRRFPDVRVRFDAVEARRSGARKLAERAKSFDGDPPDGVDYEVHQRPFEAVVNALVEHVRSSTCPHFPPAVPHAHRSLWLLDPFGAKAIPHKAVRPIEDLVGSELLVNLDTSGVGRMIAVELTDYGPSGVGDAAVLERLFGDDRWHAARGASMSDDGYERIARLYADVFTGFPYRTTHRMLASNGQVRHMVHLSRHPKARDEFARHFEAALRAGTALAGRTLSASQRATRADQLFQRFRGVTLSVDEMHAAGAGISREQIPAVCRSAEERHLGVYDEVARTMAWAAERASTPTLWEWR